MKPALPVSHPPPRSGSASGARSLSLVSPNEASPPPRARLTASELTSRWKMPYALVRTISPRTRNPQPTGYCAHVTQPTVPSAKRSQSATGVGRRSARVGGSGAALWAAHTHTHASGPPRRTGPGAGRGQQCRLVSPQPVRGPSGAAQSCVWVRGPERCPAAAHTRATAAYPDRAR